MSQKLRVEDIEELYFNMTEYEIMAAMSVMKSGEEKDILTGQGYILAVNRCRKVLREIMKHVEC
jgi:hypothetical protein